MSTALYAELLRSGAVVRISEVPGEGVRLDLACGHKADVSKFEMLSYGPDLQLFVEKIRTCGCITREDRDSQWCRWCGGERYT